MYYSANADICFEGVVLYYSPRLTCMWTWLYYTTHRVDMYIDVVELYYSQVDMYVDVVALYYSHYRDRLSLVIM